MKRRRTAHPQPIAHLRAGLAALRHLISGRSSVAITASLLSVLATAACDDGITLPSDESPTPGETPPPPPPPPPAAAILGDTVYAVDLQNRLLVFGTESFDVISRSARIRGVSVFSRLVGIDFRPSNGLLYGVGNDSKVYVVNPATAVATPVNNESFTPAIASFFDASFGMAFEPKTEKIRLVSAEFGVTWIIDPDDGTAEGGGSVRFAEGDVNEGSTPSIAGLAFLSKAEAAGSLALVATADMPISADLDCADVLYAVDPDLGYLLGTCDPDWLDFESIFAFNQASTRCTSIVATPLSGFFVSVRNTVDGINQMASYDPETEEWEWIGPSGAGSGIQSTAVRP